MKTDLTHCVINEKVWQSVVLTVRPFVLPAAAAAQYCPELSGLKQNLLLVMISVNVSLTDARITRVMSVLMGEDLDYVN